MTFVGHPLPSQAVLHETIGWDEAHMAHEVFGAYPVVDPLISQPFRDAFNQFLERCDRNGLDMEQADFRVVLPGVYAVTGVTWALERFDRDINQPILSRREDQHPYDPGSVKYTVAAIKNRKAREAAELLHHSRLFSPSLYRGLDAIPSR